MKTRSRLGRLGITFGGRDSLLPIWPWQVRNCTCPDPDVMNRVCTHCTVLRTVAGSKKQVLHHHNTIVLLIKKCTSVRHQARIPCSQQYLRDDLRYLFPLACNDHSSFVARSSRRREAYLSVPLARITVCRGPASATQVKVGVSLKRKCSIRVMMHVVMQYSRHGVS
jgi:hypothetical protein